ncbi:flagellar basal body-associated FliL family protein [Thermaurantiacus sp.]
MAEALTITEEDPDTTRRKPGLLKRLLLPLLMLIIGAGGGAAAMYFLPSLLPVAGPPKPPAPKVAPLTYIELDNSFTANLKGSARFIQVKLALSTHGGDTVAQAVERHRPAIIAAVLATLSETTPEDLEAPGGRDRLTTRMRMAINDVLQRKSGVAGVDDVFLTSFVVQ